MRFANILLLLDSGSQHAPALRRAVALARNEHAALTICDVVTTIPTQDQRKRVVTAHCALTDIAISAKRERIKKLLESVDINGITLSQKVLLGKPHIEVAREVRNNDHDLVIKSVTGRRALRSLAGRRADRELLRSCPCPVWLVNARDTDDKSCILAALDMPSERDGGSRLNDRILEVSTSIAIAEFRKLHVVHAWQLTGESHMRSRGTAASNLEIDRMVVRDATRRMVWLRDTVNASRSDSYRIATDYLAPELHVIKGSPKNIIPELADKIGGALIVMGSAARSGVHGLWLGNTSEKILSRSDCSLLVVKQSDRLSYPATDKGLNKTHYDLASTAIGDRRLCIN